jgi:hypothetical protein
MDTTNLKLNFKWKDANSQFGGVNGKDLFLNRINIGEVSWNYSGAKGKPDNENYVGQSKLYNKRWYGTTEKEVQDQVENAITQWFKEALKEGIE